MKSSSTAQALEVQGLLQCPAALCHHCTACLQLLRQLHLRFAP